MSTTTTPSLTPMVVSIAAMAAMAGLLFGYDVGVISGAILFIKQAFLLTSLQEGMVVGAVPFGALAAAAACGKFNDFMGRRSNLLITAVLFVIGSIGSTMATGPDMLIFSRLVIGLAIGMGSFSAPLYISEVSEQEHRGGLVTLNQLAIVSGILLAYLVDYLFSGADAWRYMFLCGVVPAMVLFIFAWLLPESPRWLMMRGKTEKAHRILKRIHGKEEAQKEFSELQKVTALEKNTSKSILQKGFIKVLLLGVLVSVFTQAIGINAIIYYAPTIFKLTGFSHTTAALLATLGVGIINVVFTIIAIRLLDVFGRRPLLLVSVAGIVLSLIIMVIAFTGDIQGHIVLAWLTFFAIILFIACQAIGTGPACWLIPSEIFPTSMRGLGMGLSVACNWGTNVVVAFLFPVILSHWGGLTSFAIFLVIAIIAFVYFYRYLPETKGVTLEHIEKNLYAGIKTRDLGG